MFLVTFYLCNMTAKCTGQPHRRLTFTRRFSSNLFSIFSEKVVFYMMISCHPNSNSLVSTGASLKNDGELTLHSWGIEKPDSRSVIAFCVQHHLFLKISCLFAITITERRGGKVKWHSLSLFPFIHAWTWMRIVSFQTEMSTKKRG